MTRSLKESELVQLAIRSFGESTRVHSRADLRLPSVRQPWIGFLSEGYSAGFACRNDFRSKKMEFAVPTHDKSVTCFITPPLPIGHHL